MKDEEIQKKLIKLESAVLKENTEVAAPQKSTELTANERSASGSSANPDAPTKDDFKYFGGMALVMLGLFLLFQHVKLTTGYWFWGMSATHGIGLMLIPLIFGIGWIFYNAKSIWGWIITAVSIITMVFTVLATLRLQFDQMSMLGVIMMLLPFAFGFALILQGIGGPKGLQKVISDKIAESKADAKSRKS